MVTKLSTSLLVLSDQFCEVCEDKYAKHWVLGSCLILCIFGSAYTLPESVLCAFMLPAQRVCPAGYVVEHFWDAGIGSNNRQNLVDGGWFSIRTMYLNVIENRRRYATP